jgi:hypothetical protein
MSNVSAYEDIVERLEENRPQRRIFRPLDSLDPHDFDVTDYNIADQVETLRLRLERYAFERTVDCDVPEIRRKHDLNEDNRRSILELRAQLTPENQESLMRRIEFLERANAERLHDIAGIVLTPAQQHNIAAFERRLFNGTPRQSHCYCCKRPLLETAHDFCIGCGGVWCTSCEHCFCNWGAT